MIKEKSMQNNQNSHNPKFAARINEQGFSLLELVVAMVIFLIVTAAIYGVLQTAQLSRSVVNEKVQLNKNVRLSLNLLGRDTYNAGYGYPLKSTVILPNNRISTLLGIPADADNTRDTVPPIIAGNNITVNTVNGGAGALTDQVTFLFKDTTFNLIGPVGREVSQPLSIFAPTNAAGVSEIAPTSGTNSSCRINDIYLVTGSTSSTLALVTGLSGTNKVQFSNGDVLGFNQLGGAGFLSGITVPASLQRVKMVTYFVTADGVLTRREYANVPPAIPAVASVDEPLVYGVENFQIQYVLNDGTISNNPSAGPNGILGDGDDNQAILEAVRQVRFTIDVRSTELNSSGDPYRVSMSSTFSTRNLGYDAN